jgi:hypothetical protein
VPSAARTVQGPGKVAIRPHLSDDPTSWPGATRPAWGRPGGRFQRQACSGIWCRPRLCRGPGVGWPPWCGGLSPGIRRRPRRRCGSVQGFVAGGIVTGDEVQCWFKGGRYAPAAPAGPPTARPPAVARPACARQRRRPLVLRRRTTAAIPGRVSSPLTPGPALRAAGRSHGRFGRPRAPCGRRSAMGYAHP